MTICYSCSFSRSSRLVVFLKIVFLKNVTYILQKICDRATFKTRFLECEFLRNLSKQLLCRKLMSSSFWTSIVDHKNHKVQLQKPLSFKFIFCNVFATQNFNSKTRKTVKNKNWCDTWSIYSHKFSGLGYRLNFSSEESSIKN